jgi:hypothetical protein
VVPGPCALSATGDATPLSPPFLFAASGVRTTGGGAARWPNWAKGARVSLKCLAIDFGVVQTVGASWRTVAACGGGSRKPANHRCSRWLSVAHQGPILPVHADSD